MRELKNKIEGLKKDLEQTKDRREKKLIKLEIKTLEKMQNSYKSLLN